VFDVGGHAANLENWANFYRGSIGIVFVFDSSNEAQLEEVKELLHKTVQEEHLAGVPVMVLGNK
jgi:GTPase SAR1 family protein